MSRTPENEESNGRWTSEADASVEQAREVAFRRLLRTFVVLTIAIAVIAIAYGQYREAVFSLAGACVYAILLFGLERWGVRRVGYLTTAWYNLLALVVVAEGRGIYDVAMILFPAGMFMGALLLDRRHLLPMVTVQVAAVAAIGTFTIVWPGHGRTLSPGKGVEVVVVVLLMVVAGVLTEIMARSLRGMLEERRRAEEIAWRIWREYEERNESLQLVNELVGRLQHNLAIPEIVREAIDVLVRFSQPPMVAFYLLNEEEATLDLIAQRGFGNHALTMVSSLPVDGSMSGLAIRERRMVSSDDMARDGQVQQKVGAILTEYGLNIGIAVPLIFGERAFGTMNVAFAAGRELTLNELDTFQAVAQAVALAITNAHHVTGLEHQAFHDSLTGLPNRASLNQRLSARFAGSEQQEKLAVVLVDLNRFREVNEALGHRLGDELLKGIGSRLGESLTEHPAEVFRLGGDEFAVLVGGIESPEDGVDRARQLLAAIGEPLEIAGMSLGIAASAGVAVAPDDAIDSEEILRCADVAMYQAKRNVGGVARYASQFDENTPERLTMMSELARAVRNDEIGVHFQPKIALQSGTIVGFEALVRWRHPRLGLLLPGEFLSLAENSDLINPLTYRVVEESLRQLRKWQQQHPLLTMAVNLSVRNLLDRNCSKTLEEIIRKTSVDPSYVEFELTETAVMTDPDLALSMLSRITETGARLSIDDFGTGYSSLSYLQRFPVSEIKIDRSFVSDMADGGQSHAIVESTIHLAQSLGLSVVAEGIEDRRTADALRELDCEFAQGFFFAPPEPAEEIGRRLARDGLLLVRSEPS